MTRETKKVSELEMDQKLFLGSEEYTFKGMDGSYARILNKCNQKIMVSCGTLVEVDVKEARDE